MAGECCDARGRDQQLLGRSVGGNRSVGQCERAELAAGGRGGGEVDASRCCRGRSRGGSVRCGLRIQYWRQRGFGSATDWRMGCQVAEDGLVHTQTHTHRHSYGRAAAFSNAL